MQLISTYPEAKKTSKLEKTFNGKNEKESRRKNQAKRKRKRK